MSRIFMSPFHFFNRCHVYTRLVVIPVSTAAINPQTFFAPLCYIFFLFLLGPLCIQIVIVLFHLTLDFVLRALSLRRLIGSLCLLR